MQRSGPKAQLISLDKMMKHISLRRQIVEGVLEALPSVVVDVANSSRNPSLADAPRSPSLVMNIVNEDEMSSKHTEEDFVLVSAHEDAHAMDNVDTLVDFIYRAHVEQCWMLQMTWRVLRKLVMGLRI